MPYTAIEDLPDSVRKVLPPKAQNIFLAAYNNAWEEYREPENRRGGDSREEVAFKVAWAAVKQKYEKRGGSWQQKK